MEENSNNARLIYLYQVYMLTLNKIVEDMSPSHLLKHARGLDSVELSGIEVALTDSLRVFMNNSLKALDQIVKSHNLNHFLLKLDKKALESQILEDLKPDTEAILLAKSIIRNESLPSDTTSLPTLHETLQHELRDLESQNLYLSEDKNRIFEEILQLRLNLITKLSL